MERTAVLFITHVINQYVEKHFNKLKDELSENYELFLFYDEQKLSARAAKKLAGESVLPHEAGAWKRFKRAGRYFTEKIPGNEDGNLLHAVNRLPGYQYYWYIEYDVNFSGHWQTFFSAMELSRADLLATNLYRYSFNTDWPLWKSLEVPEGITIASEDRLHAMFPVSRFSAAAAKVLIEEYKAGWAGHFECVVPTVLNQQRLIIEDLGNEGEFTAEPNRHRFYRSTPSNNSLAPGTFVCRPCIDAPGDEPNMLWHPVKQASKHDWDAVPRPLSKLISKLHSVGNRAKNLLK